MPAPAVEVLDADITTLALDAIANAANTDLRHGGGVAAAIVRAGGIQIQHESSELAPIELGQAVATKAGALPCRFVIHAATMRLGSQSSEQTIHRATASTLRCAETLAVRTLALVAFGTGVGGISLEDAAAIELAELARHLNQGDSHLERVVFCVRGQRAHSIFTAQLARTHARGELG
jgi:O-acetyl-ADP-ribose deacetylase (regulator of RNase III)